MPFGHLRRCPQCLPGGDPLEPPAVRAPPSRGGAACSSSFGRFWWSPQLSLQGAALRNCRCSTSAGFVCARTFEGNSLAWPFQQLGTFLEYKARRAGVPFLKVDPHHTFQRCLVP
ncbi:zinc ribbon domain-containing protein [Spirillospora sp. CA-142024]|uniref:zinc ribbon domain-containing protein n=1 Tax=Spirillospora sp. CA-142024 TaxID=3240036 RepID=UPI003D8D1E51